MKITIDIPEYIEGEGVEYIWNNKGELNIKSTNNSVIISGNSDGLRALGEQCIYLSQIKESNHIHIDEVLSEIQGGKINGEIIIEKI